MTGISVTFQWWERKRGEAEALWRYHKVSRQVPRRKTLVGQRRAVDAYFLRLLKRRVTATTDIDRACAWWAATPIEHTNAVWR